MKNTKIGRPRMAEIAVGTLLGHSTVLRSEDRPRKDAGVRRVYTLRCHCGTVWDVYAQAVKDRPGIKCPHCAGRSAAQTRLQGHSKCPPERRVWRNMLARCCNPKHPAYDRYGGRGVTVAEAWRDFATFYADMGERPPKHSLDRIDNAKGYSRENCCWATSEQQNRNTRANVWYELDGKKQLLVDWARDLGSDNPTVLGNRIRVHGWSIRDALTTPIKPRRTDAAKATGVVGVYWHSRDERYQACVYEERRQKHLGYFGTLEEAVAARTTYLGA